MKLKLLFLILAATFLTYLIFTTNNKKNYDIISIYDKTTTINPNYNDYLKEMLTSKINFNYTEPFNNKNLEIENVIAIIETNQNKIQEKLNQAEIIIIHLGDFEILKEEIPVSDIIIQLSQLLKIIKNINNKQIIFLSPVNAPSSYLFKDLCNKYKIYFINSSNYLNQSDYENNIVTESGHKKLAKIIYKNIYSSWNLT